MSNALVTRGIQPYRQALPENEQVALFNWLGTFYKFQLEWLLEDCAYAICNKGRQMGLSHTSSAVGVLWAAFLGQTTTIISIGEQESREVLDKARKHAHVLQSLGSRMALPGRTNNSIELSFVSGGRIIALPSSGGRGYTGNVFLDEFAYQGQADKVWESCSAVTSLGGKLRVASTPNGVGNMFHKLWKEAGKPEAQWTRYEYPIDRADSEGFPVDWDKLNTIAHGDPRLFNQLFRCSFLDTRLQYIPTELIDACSRDDLPGSDDGAYYAGLDIGKTADLTVLTVLQKVNGLLVLKYIETHTRTDGDGLDKMVGAAFERFKLRRLCVDATGMGAFPAERMRKRHGLSKVELIGFTLQVKEDLATSLYTAFAEKKILLPKTKLEGSPSSEVVQLREDIAAIQRQITTAGNVRYDAPHTDDGHADRAWSLAMAVHAALSAPSYGRM